MDKYSMYVYLVGFLNQKERKLTETADAPLNLSGGFQRNEGGVELQEMSVDGPDVDKFCDKAEENVAKACDAYPAGLSSGSVSVIEGKHCSSGNTLSLNRNNLIAIDENYSKCCGQSTEGILLLHGKEQSTHPQLSRKTVDLEVQHSAERNSVVSSVATAVSVKPTYPSVLDTHPQAKHRNHSDESSFIASFVGMPVAEDSCVLGSSLEMNADSLKDKKRVKADIASPRKSKPGKGKKLHGSKKLMGKDNQQIDHSMVRSSPVVCESISRQYSASSNPENQFGLDVLTHRGIILSDIGPHREMPVDCPEDFLHAAAPKCPPFYPPLKTVTSTAAHVPHMSGSRKVSIDDELGKIRRPSNDVASATGVTSHSESNVEQLDRLQHHQEELHKRRAQESRQQVEEDFLRSSLRSSAKLQALENRGQCQPDERGLATQFSTGFVNDAFVEVIDVIGDSLDGVLDGMSQATEGDIYVKGVPGVEKLLSTFDHIHSRLVLDDNRESVPLGLLFIKQLFHNVQFQQAVAVHQKLVNLTAHSLRLEPLDRDTLDLVNAITCDFDTDPVSFVKEFIALFDNNLHLTSLLSSHDEIVRRRTCHVPRGSKLQECPLLQYGEERVKIVQLEKATDCPLGVTVRNDGDSIVIARIISGGVAEKSGLLHVGDEILDVNGIELRGKDINEVSDILATLSGTVTFIIVPSQSALSVKDKREVMHLRALFNYDPADDLYIPCQELGFAFIKGDILHVVQLNDASWWQAHRDNEDRDTVLAGLIPSKSFQEQREGLQRRLAVENKGSRKRHRICICGRKGRRGRKKKTSCNGSFANDLEEVLTYEEVTLFHPEPDRKRPIVLVGPQDVGRQQLREHLMETDIERFSAAIPHTSRAPMAGEEHGRDYFFTSRTVFEADMLSGKFIEYGEYQGNMYGTSIDAVRSVISRGSTAILNLQPESLKVLRETDLKPYVIFVSPPNTEKLRQLTTFLGKPQLADDQLSEVIERGRMMEEVHGHYFDYVLNIQDFNEACEELLAEINCMETDPRWIPVQWASSFNL